VLLRGINDDPATMQALCEGCSGCACVPTTVIRRSCSRAPRTSGADREGVALFRALRGRTSGFAIPQYVLDTPYGKVPLAHPYLRGREGDDVVVETYDGRLWREPNPR
jgi:lysine 2,3-aminomutase